MPTNIGHRLKPSKTKLGRFIRAHRLKLRLSQVQLAESTGLSQSEISAVETGKIQGRKKNTLKKLAKELKCELARLEKMAPEPAYEPSTELGKLIQARLRALDLTQSEMAGELKIHRACVNKWLNGKSLNVSRKLLKPLAKALALKPSALSEFKVNRVMPNRGRPAKMAFGQMIRNRRKELNWSGEVLGKKVGLTRAGISYIELQGTCSDESAEKLAKKLGLNPAELLALKPKKQTAKNR